MSTQSKSKAAPKAAETTVEAYEQVVETTKAQVEKANEAVAKGYGEFAALQKEGMDALIEAGTIWAQGVEQFGKAYLALAQEAAEANSAAAKALFSVKSLKEAVDLQGEIARKNFDKSLNESVKLSELSVKVANEAFMPIQKQLTAAVAKAGKIAA